LCKIEDCRRWGKKSVVRNGTDCPRRPRLDREEGGNEVKKEKVKQDIIKIEKNVPMPSRAKYPLGQMEIGDSFFVPGGTQTKITGAFNPHHPKKFSCRTQDGGVRVWRVA
jgi:hypothetical protein